METKGESELWTQALNNYITKLHPADVETINAIKQKSSPEGFLEAINATRKSHRDDRIARSLEKISSAILLVASVVPDFTSVAWSSIEVIYNRSRRIHSICDTLESAFVELADSLPRLLGYEFSAPYKSLNRIVLKYYTGVLELLLQMNEYINESSKKKYIFAGPPDSSSIFALIKELKKTKIDIDAEAVAVSLKLNHQLMDQVHRLIDNVVIEPKAKLPCYLITYPQNPIFRGRRKILDRMSEALKPIPGKLMSYALYGLGGVGKTQLALEFAYSHLEWFKAIFWIAAPSRAKLAQGLLDAAQQLGFTDTGVSLDENKAIKNMMSWLASCDDNWLIIFDNADDLDVLTPYWPAAKQGAILVTSRDPAALQRTWKGERVNSMEVQDAKDMFFSAVEQRIARNERAESSVEQIIQELGYLPLAIISAARIIVQTECDLSDFVSLCQENQQQPEPFAHLEPDLNEITYEHTLTTVWNLSLQTLDKQSIQLLRILTYLDPDAVPEDLIRRGSRSHKDIEHLATTTTWLRVSRDLRKHGLCSEAKLFGHPILPPEASEPATRAVATHRLVLDTVFHRCSDAEKRIAQGYAASMLISEFPTVSDSEFRLTTRWRECHMLLPQVEAMVKRCQSSNLKLSCDFVPVLCACGRYLVERRSFPDAERFFMTAQEIYKTHGVHEWPEAQFVQRSLGGIILESSTFRCQEAVEIFEGVVAFYEAVPDPDVRVLGTTYADLAQALTARGDYNEAIALCERALSMVAKIKEEKSRRDAMFHIHHNMARIYEMKGLPDEALRLHYYQGDAQGNGLRQEQSVYGAWNLYAIGNCLQLQQDQRAMETHMKALKIRLDLLGDHYYTAISYQKIGQLHLRRHDFTNANEALQEAYRILCNPTENTKAELARTLWYWATVKQEMSQYEDAAKLRQRAVRMRYDLLGQEGPEDSNFTDDDFDKLVVYYNR